MTSWKNDVAKKEIIAILLASETRKGLRFTSILCMKKLSTYSDNHFYVQFSEIYGGTTGISGHTVEIADVNASIPFPLVIPHYQNADVNIIIDE